MKEMFPPVSSVQKFATKNIARVLIKNASYNPRAITAEGKKKLKQSLEEFGSVQPPVWNARTGNLVGGHQRIEQIDALEGSTDYTLTVAVVDLDEDREKALNVILNSAEVGGHFDEVLLKRVLLDIEGKVGFDVNDFISSAEARAKKMVLDAGTMVSKTPAAAKDPTEPTDFNYQQQFGIIIMCEDAAEQEASYDALLKLGYSCKVVVT